ncbi:serine kinase, partial [Mesorhizobium marinum]|uniref:serine kinase n=1 Tax=Mesorhizobium marinum TaxID=3228790 RepID=UPI0034673AA7
MIVRGFDLVGSTLNVEAEEQALVDAFAVLMRGMDVEPARNPAFTLSVRRGAPAPIPASAVLVYEGPVFWEGDCTYVSDGDRLHLLFPDRVSLVVDPHRKAAEIVVAENDVARAGATAGVLALDAAIDESGQFMLHAAGLTLPGRDEQVLVFAPSGTGKSTTSLALADRGFGLCADDTMVIRLEDGRATGWGLPRDLKVHRNTAAMMPWLHQYLGDKWNDEDEQALTRAALSDRVRIEKAERRPIAGIFMLERGETAGSRADPMGQTDTLVSLAADNVRTGRAGLLASHRRRFACLAGLASTVPTYRLTVGSEPRSAASAIVEALGR